MKIGSLLCGAVFFVFNPMAGLAAKTITFECEHDISIELDDENKTATVSNSNNWVKSEFGVNLANNIACDDLQSARVPNWDLIREEDPSKKNGCSVRRIDNSLLVSDQCYHSGAYYDFCYIRFGGSWADDEEEHEMRFSLNSNDGLLSLTHSVSLWDVICLEEHGDGCGYEHKTIKEVKCRR